MTGLRLREVPRAGNTPELQLWLMNNGLAIFLSDRVLVQMGKCWCSQRSK